jgi:hypothetical protein
MAALYIRPVYNIRSCSKVTSCFSIALYYKVTSISICSHKADVSASPLDEDSEPVRAHHVGSAIFGSAIPAIARKIEKFLEQWGETLENAVEQLTELLYSGYLAAYGPFGQIFSVWNERELSKKTMTESWYENWKIQSRRATCVSEDEQI